MVRETTTSESHPVVAVRSDGKWLVAFEEQDSAIVLVIEATVPFGPYSWQYTYDDLGRMIFACSDWHSGNCQGDQWQYSHDGAGNLLLFDHWDAEARQTITAQYVIDGANQVECIDDASGDGKCDDGEFLWKYDPYGNLLDDHVTLYTYDAADRLSSATIDGVRMDYTYNGDGERVSQTTRARTTTYLLDVAASTVLSATTDGETPPTIYYLNGLTTLAEFDGTKISYLQYDGSGSVRQITDPAGVVQYNQTFDPYGNLFSKTDGTGSAIGFGGGTQDSNGLVYSQGQYYSPSRGLFVRQLTNILGQNLGQYQSYREMSQVAYNMQPMAQAAMRHDPPFMISSSANIDAAINAYGRGERRANILLGLAMDGGQMQSAFDAYQAGERRLWALAARGTGVSDELIGEARFINQWNADVPVVFSLNTPWYDWLPGATRIGGTGLQAGMMAAGAYMMAADAILAAQADAFAAGRFAYLDELIGADELQGWSIRQTIAQDSAFRRLYAKAGWVDAEAAAWQYADDYATAVGGGPGLTDVDYARMAAEYVGQANDPRHILHWFTSEGKFVPDNTTFGFGSSHMEGSGALIDYLAGTNDFPNIAGTKQWSWLRERAEDILKPAVLEEYPDVVWFGGELVSGENSVIEGKLSPKLHLEYIMAHSKGLPPNSRVAFGIANKICDACTSMMTGLGGQQISGGVWRVPLENGTVIFFAGR